MMRPRRLGLQPPPHDPGTRRSPPLQQNPPNALRGRGGLRELQNCWPSLPTARTPPHDGGIPGETVLACCHLQLIRVGVQRISPRADRLGTRARQYRGIRYDSCGDAKSPSRDPDFVTNVRRLGRHATHPAGWQKHSAAAHLSCGLRTIPMSTDGIIFSGGELTCSERNNGPVARP
jgi:hypothetical protein